MQLRVARLCLDCEELHVGDVCPVCASESYAFLSTWLPSHERRAWRRGRSPAQEPRPEGIRAWLQVIVRWWNAEEIEGRPPLRTRASDHVPPFDFAEPPQKLESPPALEPHPVHPSQKADS
jgi:hypothetical protein